jgi:hypothetical protein
VKVLPRRLATFALGTLAFPALGLVAYVAAHTVSDTPQPQLIFPADAHPSSSGLARRQPATRAPGNVPVTVRQNLPMASIDQHGGPRSSTTLGAARGQPLPIASNTATVPELPTMARSTTSTTTDDGRHGPDATDDGHDTTTVPATATTDNHHDGSSDGSGDNNPGRGGH